MYAAAALACVLAFGFVGACDSDERTFRIRSASMEPTLHCERPAELCGGEVSDTIVAEEVEGALDRGDIVVYELTPRAIELCGAESGKFVSRIVALPGERIAVRRGLVRVDGKVLEEPYVKRKDLVPSRPARAALAQGEYFVMGDNRAASCDSRAWGPLLRSQVVGRVDAIERGAERIEVE